MTQLVTRDSQTEAVAVEQAMVMGDLAKLTPAERVVYYNRVCESLRLNPLTKPFAYITLNGKLTLYATRDATDQLRDLKGISVQIVSRELLAEAGVYIVTARAQAPDGRADEAIGAVPMAGLKGEAYANAIMKAETKAKRRVTLSIAGLGWLDESEAPSIAAAGHSVVDTETGEVLAPPWDNAELGHRLQAAALAMKDLSYVLGQPVTKDTYVDLISGYLAAEPGRTLATLITDTQAALATVSSGEPAED